MEGLKKRVEWLMSMIVVMTLMSHAAESRQPVLHRVGGGRFTWDPSINFTDWSSKEHFYLEDWLYFGFDKHIYNVLEVNKTSYENCIDKDYIYNVTRGGRDVFNFTEAKTYYLLQRDEGCCLCSANPTPTTSPQRWVQIITPPTISSFLLCLPLGHSLLFDSKSFRNLPHS